MKAAAFFDLDHTLISRATPIALANSFRRRRLIRRRDLIRLKARMLREPDVVVTYVPVVVEQGEPRGADGRVDRE